jgi:DNA-binding NarL/FixJ family response regulator
MSLSEFASPTRAPPPTAAPLRAFLADDHPVVLAGIKALVMEDERFRVVGEARDGPSALQQCLVLKPDILILDISMPGLNGVKVAEALLSEFPTCRILALTVHEDRAYLRQLLRIGVSGYLLKRSAAEELIRALTAIAGGGLYLDPAVAGLAVASNAAVPDDAVAGTVELSPREMEVIRLTASGHSNKSVAAELGIGVKSAETYKARAMDKLGFRTRVELVRFALSRGWLTH